MAKINIKNRSLILELAKSLFHFSPFHYIILLNLMLFRALTAGIGLLLIIPLLHAIGFDVMGNGQHSLTPKILSVLKLLHIPLHLWSILLTFVFMLTLVASAHFFEETIRSKWHERYLHHLRESTYRALMQTKWPFFTQRNRSDFLHGITAQLQSVWQSQFQLLQLMSQLILVGVYFGLSSLLSWQMTLIASGVSLGLLGILRPMHRLTSQSGRQFLQRNQTLFQAFYEQLSAFKLIKSCHAESQFIAKILEESQSLQQKMQRMALLSAASKWLYSVGTAIAFSLLLYIAIVVCMLPAGTLLLLLIVFSRLVPIVSSLQQGYQRLLQYLPGYCSLKQLHEDCLMNQEPMDREDPTPISFQEAIVFDNVSFSYPSENSQPLVHQLSLRIKKNTSTALIGPSGIGKTTIADLMVGLLEPSAGAIYIDQQRLDSHTLSSWRKLVAYVPQDAFLFNATIAENLRLFCKEAKDDALWDVLSQVSAACFVANLEKGLDTFIGDRGVRLSGGERQRIALARALLMKPQLLILDESTNSLDAMNIEQVQQSLAKLHGEMTILIISHQSEMSDFSDQVISIQNAPLTQNKQVVLSKKPVSVLEMF